MIYTVLYLLICMVYIRFPVLSPPCQNLIVFGHPGQILAEAEEELATLPQLATEDMFITEHYFYHDITIWKCHCAYSGDSVDL